MKKILIFSLLTATLLAVGTFAFISCSNDEADDAHQAKVELLKAKAKEFAKKYNVEMSLNEDNLDQIAETLTVEQMEKDFQDFANTKEIVLTSSPKVQAKTKGLKITRAKVLTEESQPASGGGLANLGKVHEGSAEDHASARFINGSHYCQFDFSIKVKWQYSLQSSDINKVTVTITETNRANVDTSNVTGYVCPGNDDEGDRVNASGKIKVSGHTYSVTFSFSFFHNSKTKQTSTQIS